MSDGVSEPWAGDADVTDLTDVDLQASRSFNTKVSDSSHELHRLVETLRREQGLDDWSQTVDRAIRIEVACAIDARDVTFTRDDYDVAFTIPPAVWAEKQIFSEVELVDEDDVDTSERAIGFSTPEVVKEMVDDAIDEGAYDSITDMVRSGVNRMLGRK